MTSPRAAKVTAILVYTGLRIGLFLLVWLTIELLTPISGVWALVAALLISGALSVVLLDRQRGRMAVVADGFFKGINERIEASTRAEDLDEPLEDPREDDVDSGESQQQADGRSIDQQ